MFAPPTRVAHTSRGLRCVRTTSRTHARKRHVCATRRLKLPRDPDGKKLPALLRPYGCQITRQTGSHLRLTSARKGRDHHVTIPAHRELSVGTLHRILRDVAMYLEMELATFLNELFGP
jgi:predicted RNA binding protein YcfA (HicA-like mRNA interferase family)